MFKKGYNSSRNYNTYEYMHLNKRTPKSMKQTLTEFKEEIENNSRIISGDFHFLPFNNIEHIQAAIQ